MAHGVFGTLMSGMWHGYRRWATLFNTISIILSVILAVVILRFSMGVRDTIRNLVRKEAAAGAVRVHLGGWRPESSEGSFSTLVREADAGLRAQENKDRYQGFHFWWRSEAHFLMLEHPADAKERGIYAKLGNTTPNDPEAARVRPYVVGGTWIEDDQADQIVLSSQTALKLVRRLPDSDSVKDLVGRTIWIALPGTREHRPAACAQVKVMGIFDHLRDQACMTTPGVIQKMYARTRANANGKWYETYDRMAYRDTDRSVPLICWRVRETESRWISPRGLEAGDAAFRLSVRPEGRKETFSLDHDVLADPPPSERMSLEDLDRKHPGGYVLCSPRVWEDLGFEAAPLQTVEPWQEEAIYAYLYFERLDDAERGRAWLTALGFETYMPIDRFQGLRALARVITLSALVLLTVVLLAGLLGIMVTLYTEVDAEEREIGLLKALGASNATVGWVFLGKGAVIGTVGALVGVPLAGWLGRSINQALSGAVAQTAGLTGIEEGFFSRDLRMGLAVGVGVIVLAAVAALLPALQAAGKDPQEALRAE